MLTSFESTKKDIYSEEVRLQDKRESHEKTEKKDQIFNWSPEASPTQKRHQVQAQSNQKVEVTKDGEITLFDSFETMGLCDEILRGVYAYGYEKPSAIQQRAIVPCTQGRDVVAQAQSGTGKTATFSIALLQQIDTSKNVCQVMFQCTIKGHSRSL